MFRYGGGSFSMGTLVKSVLGGRNTRFDVDEIIRFVKEYDMSSGQRSADQAIESGENNLKWMNANYEVIHKWLKEQNERHVYY